MQTGRMFCEDGISLRIPHDVQNQSVLIEGMEIVSGRHILIPVFAFSHIFFERFRVVGEHNVRRTAMGDGNEERERTIVCNFPCGFPDTADGFLLDATAADRSAHLWRNLCLFPAG